MRLSSAVLLALLLCCCTHASSDSTVTDDINNYTIEDISNSTSNSTSRNCSDPGLYHHYDGPIKWVGIASIISIFPSIPYLLCYLIPAIGFTILGVAANSVAAMWQSAIGNVVKGSPFAILQSIGATMGATMGTVLLLGPVILVALLIALIVLSIQGYVVPWWDCEVEPWFSGAASDINSASNSSINWPGSQIDTISNTSDKVGNWVGSQIDSISNSSILPDTVNTISNATDTVGKWAGSQIDSISNSSILPDTVNTISNTSNTVGNWVGSQIDTISNTSNTVGNWVGSQIDSVSNSSTVNKVSKWFNGLTKSDSSTSSPGCVPQVFQWYMILLLFVLFEYLVGTDSE